MVIYQYSYFKIAESSVFIFLKFSFDTHWEKTSDIYSVNKMRRKFKNRDQCESKNSFCQHRIGFEVL